MSTVEQLPLGDGCAQWAAWGTTVRLVVTDPSALFEAQASVRAELAAVDQACSRFRDDAELQHAYRAAGRPVEVSELLAELVEVALRAARDTGGDVDPTLGTTLSGLGYDRDFATITGSGPAILVPAPPEPAAFGRPAPCTWERAARPPPPARPRWACGSSSTAAVVRGRAGLAWLGRQGAPARLVAQDRGVHTTSDWPA